MNANYSDHTHSKRERRRDSRPEEKERQRKKDKRKDKRKEGRQTEQERGEPRTTTKRRRHDGYHLVQAVCVVTELLYT
jgi:hypothetical protein